MARTIKYNKDDLIEGGVNFIKIYGIDSLCVRSVVNFIGCSTQPIFKNFINFENYKESLKEKMYEEYKNFISEIVDLDNHLFSISYGYVMYSKKENNVFIALFNTNLAGTRSIKQIIEEEKNNCIIRNSSIKYNISLKQSEDLFIKIRFFTHGIATQLSSKTLEITDKELKILIQKTIEQLLEGGKDERNF